MEGVAGGGSGSGGGEDLVVAATGDGAEPTVDDAYILRSCCATIELGGDCSGLDQSNLI
jgi:hypothetical protein